MNTVASKQYPKKEEEIFMIEAYLSRSFDASL